MAENEFEQALQIYECAVREYQMAWRHYVDTVGLHAAQPTLERAMNRICALDTTPLAVVSQDETEQRAGQAVMIVDAELHTSPDIYAHRPEYARGGIIDEQNF